ncbi:MAG: biopolymer transporter ExbD, partial [Flavobacteriaceae bacterium]|nr:biopolymer transporter ExbD [Flavobacteriaceae bacterium]
IDINERNILEININSNNDIMVEGIQISDISEIRQLALDFIDNGSGTDTAGNPCTWCGGKKDTNSSEHPDKAIIEIQSNRNSSYATYIAVQNAVLGAYAELRDRRALE